MPRTQSIASLRDARDGTAQTYARSGVDASCRRRFDPRRRNVIPASVEGMALRTWWWTTAVVVLTASTAGAQLDPERNHLACYPVKGKTIKRTIVLDNALGSERTASLRPVQVCVPTAKTATPAGSDPVTVGVPYFTCYKFKVKGKREKQTLSLVDQFGTTSLAVTRPNLLCAPALPAGATTTSTTTAGSSSTLPATSTSTTTSTAPTTSTSSTAMPTTSTGGATTSTSSADTTTISTGTVPTSTTTTVTDTTTTQADTTTTQADTTTSQPDTSTTSTDTTSSSTTTTLSTCNLAAGDPQLMCTGVCPAGFSCLYTGAQGNPCGCAPVANECANLPSAQCGSGLCPGGLQTCAAGLFLDMCGCVDIG